MRQRDALGHLAADDQPADQPRPGAGRHAAQLAEPQPGARHHAAHQVRQQRQMRPRGDLRHHAAIRRVRRLLAGDALGQHAAVAVQHRRRGFVARRFDPQHRPHQYDRISTFPIFPGVRMQ